MSLLQRTAAALSGDRTGKVDLNLDQIRTDGGTQPRAEINMAVVRDYADAITNGVELPAATVFYDGTSYWLADGYHRLAAHRMADKRSILADVRQGTQRDAVLWSVGANAEHGLRRTDEDKRRAVLRLLEDQEWGGWSDREIARQCRVSPTFVGKLRAGLTVHVDSEQPQGRTYTTKHGTQAIMRTERIGSSAKPAAMRTVEAAAPAVIAEEQPRDPRPTPNAAGLPALKLIDRFVAAPTATARPGRLRATLDAVLVSLDNDDLRSEADALGVNEGYNTILKDIQYLRKVLGYKTQ